MMNGSEKFDRKFEKSEKEIEHRLEKVVGWDGGTVP